MNFSNFGNLYKTKELLVRNIVKKYRFPKATEDDIVQDVFVTALEKHNTLQKEDSINHWLCSIARNRCIDEYRKQKRRLTVTIETLDEETSAYPKHLLELCNNIESLQIKIEKENLNNLIQKFIQHLKEPAKTIVQDYYFQDVPVREIAKKYNLKENTVNSHLLRFRTRCKIAILEYLKQIE